MTKATSSRPIDGTDVPAPTGPLAGVRVLDITQFILGPLATQILGDMGADVIKVETPYGDSNRHIGRRDHPGMSAMFLGVNRNKRSVVLDLNRPDHKEAFLRIADGVDVFVHSLRADSAERLGVDYASLSARNPRLVYASAPGYRSDGPLRTRPAYDDVIQGESGIPDINRMSTGNVRYLPIVIADKFCGYTLASAISMALYHRSQTGRGQAVEVPMLETMLSFNLVEHLWDAAFADSPGSMGYDRALMPERRPFETLDGHVCAMATSDAQWERVFATFGRSDLARDPRFSTLKARSAHFPEVYAALAAEIAKYTTAEALRRLDEAQIPNAPVRRLADMQSDPYLVETGYFQRYRNPKAGSYVTPSISFRFSESPPQIRRPPPCLGEHTGEVLAEFGIRLEQGESK